MKKLIIVLVAALLCMCSTAIAEGYDRQAAYINDYTGEITEATKQDVAALGGVLKSEKNITLVVAVTDGMEMPEAFTEWVASREKTVLIVVGINGSVNVMSNKVTIKNLTEKIEAAIGSHMKNGEYNAAILEAYNTAKEEVGPEKFLGITMGYGSRTWDISTGILIGMAIAAVGLSTKHAKKYEDLRKSYEQAGFGPSRPYFQGSYRKFSEDGVGGFNRRDGEGVHTEDGALEDELEGQLKMTYSKAVLDRMRRGKTLAEAFNENEVDPFEDETDSFEDEYDSSEEEDCDDDSYIQEAIENYDPDRELQEEIDNYDPDRELQEEIDNYERSLEEAAK